MALDDVARVMAAVATTDGHEGQNYQCTGPLAIDISELADVFSRALGCTIEYIDLPEDKFARMLLDHAPRPRWAPTRSPTPAPLTAVRAPPVRGRP